MARFRSIPWEFEAVQVLPFTSGGWTFSEMPDWLVEAQGRSRLENGHVGVVDGYVSVMTRSSWMHASPGDWIVMKGPDDLYVVKGLAFQQAYEPA